MKINVNIPKDDYWPSQWRGKTVEVEVVTIRFPDSVCWSCESLLPMTLAGSPNEEMSDEEKLASLVNMIGGSPSSIEIKFQERK